MKKTREQSHCRNRNDFRRKRSIFLILSILKHRAPIVVKIDITSSLNLSVAKIHAVAAMGNAFLNISFTFLEATIVQLSTIFARRRAGYGKRS